MFDEIQYNTQKSCSFSTTEFFLDVKLSPDSVRVSCGVMEFTLDGSSTAEPWYFFIFSKTELLAQPPSGPYLCG